MTQFRRIPGCVKKFTPDHPTYNFCWLEHYYFLPRKLTSGSLKNHKKKSSEPSIQSPSIHLHFWWGGFILNFQGFLWFFIMPCLAVHPGMQGTSHSPPSSGCLGWEQSVSYVSKRLVWESLKNKCHIYDKRIKIYI